MDSAYGIGAAQALEKFAIDAATLRKMTNVYSYMSPDQFNQVLNNRMRNESRGMVAPTQQQYVDNMAFDPTYVRPRPPGPPTSIAFNREQLQNMSTPEVYKQMTGQNHPASPFEPTQSLVRPQQAKTISGRRPR